MDRLRFPRVVPSWLKLVIVIGAAAGLFLASAGISSAHFLGNRFYWPYSSGQYGQLRLYYYNGAGNTSLHSATTNAANAWYYTSTPLYLYTTTDPNYADIVVYSTWDSATSFSGYAYIYADHTYSWCGSNGCGAGVRTELADSVLQSCVNPCSLPSGWGDYQYVVITLNRFHLGSYTATKQQAVVGHEFGHAFGLGHTTCTVSSAGTTALLYPNDNRTATKPTAHDVYDFNRLYPSHWAQGSYSCTG